MEKRGDLEFSKSKGEKYLLALVAVLLVFLIFFFWFDFAFLPYLGQTPLNFASYFIYVWLIVAIGLICLWMIDLKTDLIKHSTKLGKRIVRAWYLLLFAGTLLFAYTFFYWFAPRIFSTASNNPSIVTAINGVIMAAIVLLGLWVIERRIPIT